VLTGSVLTGSVLTGSGPPIPGLYAVGNAAAFWTGDAYPAPGATLSIGMTMAYQAGRHAARRCHPLQPLLPQATSVPRRGRYGRMVVAISRL
jgi:hypothetical protein